MELGNLFASSDNLFKFLFLGGLTMIVISLVHPLQKEQLIELEINTHNKEVALLNNEINILSEDVRELKKQSKQTILELDSLQLLRKESNEEEVSEQITKLKTDYNMKFFEIKSQHNKFETKNIILEYNQKKIEILKVQAEEYRRYSKWLKRIGIIFTIIGLIFWSKSTFLTEKLKKKELSENGTKSKD